MPHMVNVLVAELNENDDAGIIGNLTWDQTVYINNDYLKNRSSKNKNLQGIIDELKNRHKGNTLIQKDMMQNLQVKEIPALL